MEDPSIVLVEPSVVCLDSLPVTLSLLGGDLTPAMHNLTGEPELVLPRITLSRMRDRFGEAPTSPEVFVVQEQTHVRWTTPEQMELDLTPSMGLMPGLYAATVTNPDGSSHTLANAILLVDPPDIDSIEPDRGCAAPLVDLTVTVTGGPFYVEGEYTPVLHFEPGAASYLATGVDSCTELDVQSRTFRACSSLTFRILWDYLVLEATGTRSFVVSGLPGGGCDALSPLTFDLLPCPRITSISPPLACTNEADRSFTIEGSGFVFDPSDPPVIDAGFAVVDVTSMDGCRDFTGSTRVCDSLEFVLPARPIEEIELVDVLVENIVSNDCCPPESTLLVLAPPPIAHSPTHEVDPGSSLPTIWVNGTFIRYEGIHPTITFGTDAPIPVDEIHYCDPMIGVPALATICLSFNTRVPLHLLEPGATIPFSITNPPPAGCSSTSDTQMHISEVGP